MIMPIEGLTSRKIEAIITGTGAIFDRRRYIILPNAYYGMGFQYEMDMLVVTWTGRIGYEVEIKISVSDLRRDQFKDKFKPHTYTGAKDKLSKRVAGMWYVMPVDVWEKAGDSVPADAGIIVIGNSVRCVSRGVITDTEVVVVRKPVRKQNLHKWTDQELAKMAHLLSIRVMDHRTRESA